METTEALGMVPYADQQEALRLARTLIFDAGGIRLDNGFMVPIEVKDFRAAAAYNTLALLAKELGKK